MTSHELANILLENENLPISTFANNHFQISTDVNGKCNVGVMVTNYVCGKQSSVLIGDFRNRNINGNSYVSNIIFEDN